MWVYQWRNLRPRRWRSQPGDLRPRRLHTNTANTAKGNIFIISCQASPNGGPSDGSVRTSDPSLIKLPEHMKGSDFHLNSPALHRRAPPSLSTVYHQNVRLLMLLYAWLGKKTEFNYSWTFLFPFYKMWNYVQTKSHSHFCTSPPVRRIIGGGLMWIYHINITFQLHKTTDLASKQFFLTHVNRAQRGV